MLRDDIAWTRIFSDVATVIPADVWLTSFQGQKSSGGAATTGGAAGAVRTGTIGQVTFQAKGFDQTSTARWLLRLGDLREFSGLWVPSSTKATVNGLDEVTFQSTAQLTSDASSRRIDRYTQGAQ